jgi:preprotein translocase subunit SecA
LKEAVRAQYIQKWDILELDPMTVQEHERFIMLYMVDQQWKDHMRNMDFLKEGISLQGYAQKDPLIEYKKESFDMFNELMDRMDEEIVKTLIHLQPRISDDSINRMKVQRAKEAKAMKLAGKQEEEDTKPKTFRRTEPKIGRNQPCYCGSGNKYKHCHGKRK